MSEPGPPGTPPPGVPIVVGRDEARRAAADELAKPAYAHARPSLPQRFLTWFGHRMHSLWDDLFGGSNGGGGGRGWIALLVVLALLILIVTIIRLRYGPVRREVSAERALFDDEAALDAAGYRRIAEEHAAAGRWAEAVRARLRAVIAALEERAVLEPRPGRTADVAAREAGAVLPDQARALAGAARVFDDIWYGGAAARREDYRLLAEVDEAVGKARVRVGAGMAAGGELPSLGGFGSGDGFGGGHGVGSGNGFGPDEPGPR